MSTQPEPLALDLLLSKDQRRLSVAGHHEWRESISTPQAFDEVDEFVAELRELEPEGER